MVIPHIINKVKRIQQEAEESEKRTLQEAQEQHGRDVVAVIDGDRATVDQAVRSKNGPFFHKLIVTFQDQVRLPRIPESCDKFVILAEWGEVVVTVNGLHITYEFYGELCPNDTHWWQRLNPSTIISDQLNPELSWQEDAAVLRTYPDGYFNQRITFYI